MANTVKLGTLNMPKLLRHVSHRTNQVRNLVFQREAIYNKEVMTTKATSTSGRGGGTTSLSGPAVSFGYESNTNTTIDGSTANTAYHLTTPELLFPGLQALQSPITSRSGKLERTGNRISGECTFYLPNLDTIRALDNFSENTQFDEFESYDKFLDMERIIINPSDVSATQQNTTFTFADTTPGYEIDRVQFKIKTGGTLDYILLTGNEDGGATYLKWDGNMVLSDTEWTTIDLPVRDIALTSPVTTATVYKDGTANTFTAGPNSGNMLNLDKLYGDSSNELSSLIVALTGSASVELRDIYLYKSAEWSLESIIDYRDEYIQVEAVRVRGDRTSRRRAYG